MNDEKKNNNSDDADPASSAICNVALTSTTSLLEVAKELSVMSSKLTIAQDLVQVKSNLLSQAEARIERLERELNEARRTNVNEQEAAKTVAFLDYEDAWDGIIDNPYGLAGRAQHDFDKGAFLKHKYSSSMAPLQVHYPPYSSDTNPAQHFVIPCITWLPGQEVQLYCPQCLQNKDPKNKSSPLRTKLTPDGMTAIRSNKPRTVYTLNGPMHFITERYSVMKNGFQCGHSAIMGSSEEIIKQTKQGSLPYVLTKETGFDDCFVQLVASLVCETKASISKVKHAIDATYETQFLHRYERWTTITLARSGEVQKFDKNAKNNPTGQVKASTSQPKITSFSGFTLKMEYAPPQWQPPETPSEQTYGFLLKKTFAGLSKVQDWTQRQLVPGSQIIKVDHFHSSLRDTRMGGSAGSDVCIGAVSVMNEHKYVIHMPWTTTVSYNELDVMYDQIKKLAGNTPGALAVTYVDKCCGAGSFGATIKSMLPSIQVKLDLFHALRRVQSKLDMTDSRQRAFNSAFQRAHYVYAPSEDKAKRPGDVSAALKTIPPRAELTEAVLKVCQQFSDVVGPLEVASKFTDSVLQENKDSVSRAQKIAHALNLHLVHCKNGCLSDPDGVPIIFTDEHGKVYCARGSSINECFHRVMLMAHGKAVMIGVQLAVGIERWCVYNWNSRIYAAKSSRAAKPWKAQTMLERLFNLRAVYDGMDSLNGFRNPFDSFHMPPRGTNITERAVDFTPFNLYNPPPQEGNHAHDFALQLLNGETANAMDIRRSAIPVSADCAKITVRRPEAMRSPLAEDGAPCKGRGWIGQVKTFKLCPLKFCIDATEIEAPPLSMLDRFFFAARTNYIGGAKSPFPLTRKQFHESIVDHLREERKHYNGPNLTLGDWKHRVEELDGVFNWAPLQAAHAESHPPHLLNVLRALAAISNSHSVILLHPTGDVAVIHASITSAARIFSVDKPFVFALEYSASSCGAIEGWPNNLCWAPISLSPGDATIAVPRNIAAKSNADAAAADDDDDDNVTVKMDDSDDERETVGSDPGDDDDEDLQQLLAQSSEADLEMALQIDEAVEIVDRTVDEDDDGPDGEGGDAALANQQRQVKARRQIASLEKKTDVQAQQQDGGNTNKPAGAKSKQEEEFRKRMHPARKNKMIDIMYAEAIRVETANAASGGERAELNFTNMREAFKNATIIDALTDTVVPHDATNVSKESFRSTFNNILSGKGPKEDENLSAKIRKVSAVYDAEQAAKKQARREKEDKRKAKSESKKPAVAAPAAGKKK